VSVFTDNMGVTQSAWDSLNNALQQSAMQKRALQQQQDQFTQEQALRTQEFRDRQQQGLAAALESGAKPVDASGNVQTPGMAPALTRDPQGNLTPSLVTSGTESLPANSGQTYQVAGRTFQAPSLQDQLGRSAAFENAKRDADRIPISDKLANAIGVAPGTKVSPEHLSGIGALAHWLNPAAADNSPTVIQQGTSKDDKGNQVAWRILSNGTKEETPLNAKGTTDRFGNPNDPNAPGKQLTPDAILTARNKALEEYQKSSKEESQLEQDTLALGTALKSGQHYIDRNGNLKRFDPAATPEEIAAQQDSMRSVLAAKQKRIQQVIADKNDAMQRYGTKPQVSTATAQAAIQSGMAPAAPAPPAPGAGTKTAPVQAPQVAPGAPKQIKRAQLNEYVAQFKQRTGKTITPQQAEARFKAANIQVVE
jgi:hypothetical protein